ncbi:hypothetical protein FKW77_003989 [Venturia effusa]|uniref:Uncharacterized protein n=1 Tax=Venturia effusa TaxID=50376 RepID=A0A517LAU6_9PEZI|nr:hypothetical protein FKW77_003989 [Venturia effusa]
MEAEYTSAMVDVQMCDSDEGHDDFLPEAQQADAILLHMLKDARLTPTALNHFLMDESTHVEYFRDIQEESLRKRKVDDIKRSAISADAAIPGTPDRPIAIPRSIIQRLPTSNPQKRKIEDVRRLNRSSGVPCQSTLDRPMAVPQSRIHKMTPQTASPEWEYVSRQDASQADQYLSQHYWRRWRDTMEE